MGDENFDIKTVVRAIFGSYPTKENLTVKILKEEILNKYNKSLSKSESSMVKQEIIELFLEYKERESLPTNENASEPKDNSTIKKQKLDANEEAIDVDVAEKPESKKRARTVTSDEEAPNECDKSTPSKTKMDPSKKPKLTTSTEKKDRKVLGELVANVVMENPVEKSKENVDAVENNSNENAANNEKDKKASILSSDQDEDDEKEKSKKSKEIASNKEMPSAQKTTKKLETVI